jgi:serine protease Do
MMQHKPSWRLVVLVLLAGTVLGILFATGFNLPDATESSTPPASHPVELGAQEPIPERQQQLHSFSDAFAKIADALVPTVVFIKSTRTITTADFERFHDREDLKDYFRFRAPDEFRQSGAGSGIIVSKEGYILTNVHVVEKSDKLRVILNDNREYVADMIGMDPLTEVAVIKINADNLPVARLGNSDKCRVGEWVLSIGNPLELQSTVTAGIISAKDRQIDILRNRYSVENFIQTDAAINPGNSGGALVNLRGEVIGMNTAIATETGYNSGYGFAIPINLAQKIMTDLIHKGRVERGYLGISMQDIDEKKARALGISKPTGVFVDRVLDDGPAAAAGLRPKDVILEVDRQSVNKSNQLQAIVAKKNPLETVQLTLLRQGREMNIDVMLGQRESEELAVTRRTSSKTFKDLGITCESVGRDKGRELGYYGQVGALVTHIERFSPADDAGMREDDIIVEINDSNVATETDFRRTIGRLNQGAVAIFTVVRDNEEFHLFVEIVR